MCDSFCSLGVPVRLRPCLEQSILTGILSFFSDNVTQYLKHVNRKEIAINSAVPPIFIY